MAVILSGGPGERLWPLSRPGHPKPLIEVLGRTLLGHAHSRASRLVGEDGQVLIVAQSADRTAILDALPGFAADSFLGEPMRRDTAMAVLMSAAVVAADDPEAIVVVLPADHLVEDEETFAAACRAAAALACDEGTIGLLGVVPTGPKPSLGYMSVAREGDRLRVVSFVEKPSPARAAALVEKGALWNMGVFVARARSFGAAAEKVDPRLAAASRKAAGALLASDAKGLKDAYRSAPRLSFDRAVLEHTDALFAVPVSCAWSDLGTWADLTRHRLGQGQAEDVLYWNEPGGPALQVLGLKDVVAVSTPAGVLVAPIDLVADVRPVAPAGPPVFAPQGVPQTPRSWGSEYAWLDAGGCRCRLLAIDPGKTVRLGPYLEETASFWVVAGSGTAEGAALPRRLAPGSTAMLDHSPCHLHAESPLTVALVTVAKSKRVRLAPALPRRIRTGARST